MTTTSTTPAADPLDQLREARAQLDTARAERDKLAQRRDAYAAELREAQAEFDQARRRQARPVRQPRPAGQELAGSASCAPNSIRRRRANGRNSRTSPVLTNVSARPRTGCADSPHGTPSRSPVPNTTAGVQAIERCTSPSPANYAWRSARCANPKPT